MTQRSLLKKYILILVLTAFLSAVGVATLHHHDDDKSTTDICQICDFSGMHYSSTNADILIAVDFIVVSLLLIFFSSYKYRLDNIFRNKAPPSPTV